MPVKVRTAKRGYRVTAAGRVTAKSATKANARRQGEPAPRRRTRLKPGRKR